MQNNSHICYLQFLIFHLIYYGCEPVTNLFQKINHVTAFQTQWCTELSVIYFAILLNILVHSEYIRVLSFRKYRSFLYIKI